MMIFNNFFGIPIKLGPCRVVAATRTVFVLRFLGLMDGRDDTTGSFG